MSGAERAVREPPGVGAAEADDGRAGEPGGRAGQPEGAQHVVEAVWGYCYS